MERVANITRRDPDRFSEVNDAWGTACTSLPDGDRLGWAFDFLHFGAFGFSASAKKTLNSKVKDYRFSFH